MTYKLTSDIYIGKIIIMNKNHEVVGPYPIMNWISIEKMEPTRHAVKIKLDCKKYAAAWIPTNCAKITQNFAQKIIKAMKTLGLRLDILGKCGNVRCSGSKRKDCLKKIQRDYYFYFAFEEFFTKDYVTEQLLYPLQHYTVPVVYGGANYTRFMPNGIYLNAVDLEAENLVRRMDELIRDKNAYYEYFKWHNHYSYHDLNALPEYDYYCQLCQKLHYETGTKWRSSQNIKHWWINDV